ncbi:uncharacterized protein TRUGW13939_00706 [Talaromyces rugulosus]|uniref:F-box domain-containing protein n=1 Tax=Talaromyces rugulosus TaxID=121627 RepID=A0A7H8QI18_TALRU|nr:uncharacterized protein TRUGW13939_00706 [Talaromyces rugulosus]QKX53627.1 hypothetical protein TRUGW13939_00706 [Talaromyces rugulosus]
MNLLKFPTEILILCFEPLDDISDLTTSRLVCRQLGAICGGMLWRNINVRLSTKSLKRLQYISENPEFARSVRALTFDVGLYHTDCATNLSSYSIKCINEVDYALQEAEQEWERDKTMPEEQLDAFVLNGTQLSTNWRQTAHFGETKTLMQAFQHKYRELADDQALALQECTDISKFANILRSFTNVRRVKITDKPIKTKWKFKGKDSILNGEIGKAIRSLRQDTLEYWESELHRYMDSLVFNTDTSTLTDIMGDVIASACLSTGKWIEYRGQSPPHSPVTVLGDIFTALAELSSFPTSLEVDIRRYAYVNIYKMTDKQLEYARYLPQNAKSIHVLMTHTENPVELKLVPFMLKDWEQMRKLITALGESSSKLEDLEVRIDGYLKLKGGTPFPADSKSFNIRWEKLESLCLEGVPFLKTKFEHMVKHLPVSLKKLDLNKVFLSSGSWAHATDGVIHTGVRKPPTFLETPEDKNPCDEYF